MKKWFLIFLVIALLLPPLACVSRSSSVPGIVQAPVAAGVASTGKQSTTDSSSTAEDRMIIRNGSISLVVNDVIGTRDEIAKLATNLGGWVVSSQIMGQEQETRGSISIRVPDEKFEQALADMRKLAVRVNSESTNTQDVTQEYTDLKSRLKNAEATENQYLALLNKATQVEDILKIYDSLSRVRGEIEQIKGRMQYLEQVTSMSLISANLEPATSGASLVVGSWNMVETFKSAIRGLVKAGQVIGTIAIWLLIFSPIWLAAIGVIYWLKHRRKAQA